MKQAVFIHPSSLIPHPSFLPALRISTEKKTVILRSKYRNSADTQTRSAAP